MTFQFSFSPRNNRRREFRARRMLTTLLLVAACLVPSCREKPTEPPVTPRDSLGVELALMEKGVSDAVLRITIPDTNAYRYVELFRDGTRILTMNISGREKVVEDSALTPGVTYTYRALRLSLKNDSFPSAPLPVTTLPLTSHAFRWRIDTVGIANFSFFNDVAIADDGSIWCVGMYSLSDSTGQTEDVPHNAARWNGNRWEYYKIYFPADCGRPEIAAGEISAIAKGPDGKIWFTDGASMVYWEKGVFTPLCIPSAVRGYNHAMKLTTDGKMYAVGAAGIVLYWNGSIWGSIWTRQSTETQLGLTDIAGDETGLYACGEESALYHGVVLRKDGTIWRKVIEGFVPGGGYDQSQLFKTQLYGSTTGIWMDERKTIYTVGNFLYSYRRGKWDFVRSLPRNYLGGNPDANRGLLWTVRGNGSNDYMIFGELNSIFHFNGMTWEHLGPPFDPQSDYMERRRDERQSCGGSGLQRSQRDRHPLAAMNPASHRN